MQLFQINKLKIIMVMLTAICIQMDKSMAVTVTIVDVFTKISRKGNPAAIVKNFVGNQTEMQILSKKLNFPVTVFIKKPKENYILHFFAPSSELKMCGHGTLAAAYELLKDSKPYESIIVSSASEQEIELQKNGDKDYSLTLLKTIEPKKFDGDEEISDMLAISYLDIRHDKFKPWTGSVGSPKLFVPLKNRKILSELTPNYEKIKNWSAEVSVNGLYVYTDDVIETSSHLCARSFNPLSGQNEDAATGVAVGALATIMHEFYDFPPKFEVEQGDFIDKPCRLQVFVDSNKVRVGGGVVFREEIIEDFHF